MTVVNFLKVSTLYPHVMILSLIGRLEKLFFVIFTLLMVYGPEITTSLYKG
jgi:hypothetical protein